jgi:hypothetical protein
VGTSKNCEKDFPEDNFFYGSIFQQGVMDGETYAL